MSADLVQHAFHGQAVRVITDEHGDPLFVLADLCKVLDLGNPSMVAQRVDPDALSQAEVIDSLGRGQQAHVVTESGMYEVVIRSDKPEAREFRRWVTREVLPSIRRTGAYVAPMSREQRLALAVIDAQAMISEQGDRIAELEPAAHSWATLAESTGDHSMRDTAQILSRDPDIEIGQNRLAKYLRQVGWIDPRGIPYQHHVDTGRIHSKPQTRVSHRTGERVACEPQVRITIKGLGALHKLLGGTEPVDTRVGIEVAA
jgi:prophage antirepressor-like protein